MRAEALAGRTSLRKSDRLVNKLKPGETPEQAAASMTAEGLGMNAVTAAAFSKVMAGLDITNASRP